MTLIKLIEKTRRPLKDNDGVIFLKANVVDYINEAVNRFQHYLYFVDEIELVQDSDEPTLIPAPWQHLLALYATSRCFTEDENAYEAARYMNEFEEKLASLIEKIELGEITITDTEGNEITADYEDEHVQNVYFGAVTSHDDYTPPDGF